MQNWYYSFIIALAGSWHCVLMCGPIMSRIQTIKKNSFNQFIYQSGKIGVYIILGYFVARFADIEFLGRYWFIYFISSAILIILLSTGILKDSIFQFMYRIFGKKLQEWGRGRGKWGIFLLGMSNGLLPCGLIIQGLTIAFIQPKPALGALSMLLFGLGTLPAIKLSLLGYKMADNNSKIAQILKNANYIIAIILFLQGIWGVAAQLFEPVKNSSLTPVICHGWPI